jgi:tetratricopeptide (TPR) repeat protein
MPRGQSVFHAVPLASFDNPRTWLDVVAVLGLVGVAVGFRRRAATVSLGISWFLLLLVPSVVLVLLDRAEPMAEHRVYVASMGLFLAAGVTVGALAFELSRSHSLLRFIVYAGLVVTVAGLAGRTMIRNIVWSNPVALWIEAVDRAPDHWYPRLLLGEALHAGGRRDEAIAVYLSVIELRPEEPAPYQKLALAYAETGRYEEARATFTRLGERAPRSAIVSNGYGAVALLAGDREQARAHFQESLARDPRNVSARQALAAMAEQPPADFAEALRLCQEIQQLAPRTPGNDDCIRRNQARLSR